MFRCANRPTTALSLTLSRFCAQNCLSASVVIHSDFWLLAPSSVFLFLYVLRNKLKQLMRHDDLLRDVIGLHRQTKYQPGDDLTRNGSYEVIKRRVKILWYYACRCNSM